MTSTRPTRQQLDLDFSDEAEANDAASELRQEQSSSAFMGKSALDSISFDLMEKIVDDGNMERAWKKVKANRGAPGPDGITLDEFFENFRHQWPEVRRQLLEGTYRPGPARRKSISKPDGSLRDLGIPNVVDRLIEQAILIVLTPLFDPEFSESSYGFRPKRSASGAIKQIQTTMRQGYRHCVDMDLSKFFDRVQHDVLLSQVSRKVHDKRLLKLIGRYLRAGVMVDGLLQPSAEGTMQGGPLSPFLANIMLDDFDKELERRGHHFVRYADDFLIFTKTEAAAKRVFASVERYLTGKLKLVINRQKSRVCRTRGVEFLGFEMHGLGGQIRVSDKNVKKFKDRSREILNRNRGISMTQRLKELRQYVVGWMGYFAIEQRKSLSRDLDKWLRRRLRACYWKQWRKPRVRVRKLRQLGIRVEDARSHGNSRKGCWRMSATLAVQMALTTQWLSDHGLVSLEDQWNKFAPRRRIA
jgi:RNA-directed DNA polymerase